MIKTKRAWQFTDAMRRKMDREAIRFIRARFNEFDAGEEGYAGDTDTATHYIWNGEYREHKFQMRYEKKARKISGIWLDGHRSI